jgi:hypothetical protein
MQHTRTSAVLVTVLATAAALIGSVAGAQQCPQVLERWGYGPSDAVFSRTGRSYYGAGTVFTIGDVSAPAAPSVLGEIDLGVLIHDIWSDGQTAYVAAGNMDSAPGAVFTVDVSDPSAPSVVTTWETVLPARSIAVAGDVVYVGLADPLDPDDGRLLAIEPAPSPVNPPRITSLAIAGWPERIDAANDRLWIAELGTGVRGFDIAEPQQPVELVHIAGDVRDLEAAGDLLYIASWREDDPDVLEILDVSVPDQPAPISEYRADQIRKVRVVGPIAYLASAPVESSIRLELVDVSNPADPNREDVLTLGSLRGDAFLNDLAVANRIIHLSNSRGGPWLVEAPPVGEPRMVGSFTTPGVTEAVAITDDILVVAGGESGLLLFDLGSHGDLAPLRLPVPVGGFARDVVVADRIGYVASWRDGVRILDLTDPRAPIEIGRVVTASPCFRVVVAGRYLYATLVGSPYVFTRVFDISDPQSPSAVAELEGSVLAVANGYAYIDWSDWLGRCGLATWDVSDPTDPPAEPEHLNLWEGCNRCWLPWPGYRRSYELQPHRAISGFSLVGSRAWISLGTGGLRLLDLSDPSAPVVAGSIAGAACGTTATSADRDTAYVTTAAPSGLTTVAVSSSGELVELGFQPLPGYPADAILAGTKVYTTDQTAGVSVLEVGTCRRPLHPRGRKMP